MISYNPVMAGPKSIHAPLCFREGFIGVDYGIKVDLTHRLPEQREDLHR